MKIHEICCCRRTETGVGALTTLDIEALSTWLVENLFHEFGKQLVIASPSLEDEFERRRRQRRRKRSLAPSPGRIGSPPRDDVAAAPAADARAGGAVGPAAAAPMAIGGPTLG